MEPAPIDECLLSAPPAKPVVRAKVCNTPEGEFVCFDNQNAAALIAYIESMDNWSQAAWENCRGKDD